MLDVVTLGESMILFAPTSTGLLRYASRFERFVAGAETNTAVGLTRLGHSVGWISRLGDDEFGQHILAFVRGEGIDVSQVRLDAEAPTAVFFKERRRAGLTQVYYYRAGSAASGMSPLDLEPEYIGRARFLHLTGITPALSPSCRATVTRAIQIAREAGVRISFDPNVRLKLWTAERAREVLWELMTQVDIVLLGGDEARLLTGDEDPARAAETLLQRGPTQVAIKMGAEGALAVTPDDGLMHQPAFEVQVVDTVGAGDAFNAGFLSGRLRGWSLERSLRLGAILGALATTATGDVEGLPTWKEIQPWLSGDPLPAR